MRRICIAATVACVLATPAIGQTIAIINAHIFTEGPAGEIQNGTLILRDGKVAAVGAAVPVPPSAQVFDAQGGIVTPGIVAPDAELSAVEVGIEASPPDYRTANAKLSAAFDVQYGLNPYSVLLPAARLGGITAAIVTPGYADESGVYNGPKDRELQFAGQAAAIDLAAGSDILMKPKVAMILELGEGGSERAGGGRGAAIVELQTTLQDARWYAHNRVAYDRGQSRKLSLSRSDLEALVPVVEGRMPVVIGVHSAADIVGVLALAQAQHLKIILDGVEEGWKVADRIAAAHVPVIVAPLQDLPDSFETIGATMRNAAILQKAGVLLVLKCSAGGSYRVRETRYDAGVAVAYGLNYSDALKAITLNPARAFGISDRVGSLAPGKDGDAVVWNGDPFEPLTQPIAVFIRGKQQSLTTRSDELVRRYRSQQAAYPPAYRR